MVVSIVEKGSSLSIPRSTVKNETFVHMNSTQPMKRIRWNVGTNMKLKNWVVGHKMEPYMYVVRNVTQWRRRKTKKKKRKNRGKVEE